jgi:DSBA-like thioredoxin domain
MAKESKHALEDHWMANHAQHADIAPESVKEISGAPTALLVDEVIHGFEDRLKNPRTVLHWYDFICPFCYVGQQRTAILVRHELDVIELPFQAHPEIPRTGVTMAPRNGPMYIHLERGAREAGLALNWPSHLSNTRYALAAAEWVRRHAPDKTPRSGV